MNTTNPNTTTKIPKGRLIRNISATPNGISQRPVFLPTDIALTSFSFTSVGDPFRFIHRNVAIPSLLRIFLAGFVFPALIQTLAQFLRNFNITTLFMSSQKHYQLYPTVFRAFSPQSKLKRSLCDFSNGLLDQK